MTKLIFISIFVFIVGFVTDVIWTLYIQKAAEKNKKKAAKLSVGTGIGTIVMVEGLLYNHITTLFWLAGLYCGTYYANDIEEFINKKWRNKIGK